MSGIQGLLGDEFDAEEAVEDGGYTVLEDGWYPFAILSADVEEAKSGADMFAFKLKGIGADSEGVQVYDRQYIEGESVPAMRFGRARYGTLCLACDFPGRGPEHLDEFEGLNVMAKLVFVEADGRYDAKNEVKEYRKCDPEDLEGSSTPKKKGKKKKDKKKGKKKVSSKKGDFEDVEDEIPF